MDGIDVFGGSLDDAIGAIGGFYLFHDPPLLGSPERPCLIFFAGGGGRIQLQAGCVVLIFSRGGMGNVSGYYLKEVYGVVQKLDDFKAF